MTGNACPSPPRRSSPPRCTISRIDEHPRPVAPRHDLCRGESTTGSCNQVMQRRDVLKSALAGATALAAPRIARAAPSVLKFIPQADLASLDPVWTTADVTRNHSYLVYDALYGLDNNYQPHPQMVAGRNDQRGQAAVGPHAARRAEIPRQHAGAGEGLCGLHPALVEARRVRRRARRRHRRGLRPVRQGDPLPAEEALRPAAGRARGAVLDHAGAAGQDRSRSSR